MLENYAINEFDVVYQVQKNKFTYDKNYVNVRYNSYGELTNYMSNLRLGYIIGTIGCVPLSILDVGYGNGSFLKTCNSIILDCYGHDVSGYEIPEGCTFIDNITSKYFDVITFFDSLEHYDNIDFVGDLNASYICISVPWCHYLNDEWFKNWKHRREDEHLFHFNEKSLEKFMGNHGYSMINYCNLEDTIRKSSGFEKNILTAMFKRI